MTGTDIGDLADFICEINCKIAEQTEDGVMFALQIKSNGDDVCVSFLGETVFSSVEDGSKFATARQVILDMIPSRLESISKIKL